MIIPGADEGAGGGLGWSILLVVFRKNNEKKQESQIL
jgi:hypothetical protein